MRDPELAARAADSAARRAAEVEQQEFDESKRAVEEADGALFWFDRITMAPLNRRSRDTAGSAQATLVGRE